MIATIQSACFFLYKGLLIITQVLVQKIRTVLRTITIRHEINNNLFKEAINYGSDSFLQIGNVRGNISKCFEHFSYATIFFF